MSRFLQIVVDGVFLENLALASFLGMCTLLAMSRRVGTALGVGAAVLGVQVVALPLANLVHRHVLAEGAWTWAGLPDVDLRHLTLVAFVGIVAAVVQVLDLVLDRWTPALHRALGAFLPLVTVNCAILGGALFMVERRLGLADAAAYGVGTGVGWALAIVVVAGVRERLRYSDVPTGLRGLGIAFVVVGLVALGFLSLAGVRVGGGP